ncbi:MAG: transcriptional repressor [Planctomycetota bacterium]|jgi:Fur family ferric uptake transcriptional regulator|nr:transcriptional repressor [Planctomycetota bacterium]
MDPLATALDQLRHAGQRITPVREAVLGAVLASDSAVSHADLEQHLGAGFDKVSIYRSLEWLEQHGIIHRFASRERTWLFSAGDGDGAHLHFTCSNCGTRSCMDALRLPRIALPPGYSCDSLEVLATGLCATCAKAG